MTWHCPQISLVRGINMAMPKFRWTVLSYQVARMRKQTFVNSSGDSFIIFPLKSFVYYLMAFKVFFLWFLHDPCWIYFLMFVFFFLVLKVDFFHLYFDWWLLVYINCWFLYAGFILYETFSFFFSQVYWFSRFSFFFQMINGSSLTGKSKLNLFL